MSSGGLGDFTVWVRLDSMDQIRELDRILNEEHLGRMSKLIKEFIMSSRDILGCCCQQYLWELLVMQLVTEGLRKKSNGVSREHLVRVQAPTYKRHPQLVEVTHHSCPRRCRTSQQSHEHLERCQLTHGYLQQSRIGGRHRFPFQLT